MIRSPIPSKSTGPDRIPSKRLKISANIINNYQTDVINKELIHCSFIENAKTATGIKKKLEVLK